MTNVEFETAKASLAFQLDHTESLSLPFLQEHIERLEVLGELLAGVAHGIEPALEVDHHDAAILSVAAMLATSLVIRKEADGYDAAGEILTDE